MIFLLLLAIFISSTLSTHTPPQLVVKFPRFNKSFDDKIYTGYVETNKEFGRNLFYYFAVARETPEEKPLVLWLNGGPGCSSALGFISEHGPFTLSEEGWVDFYKYPLTNFANVIYVDSPAGVGFSYELHADKDHGIGDDQTTADLYIFLQEFLGSVFPEYANHEFQIWGESYGGHYVPQLAAHILKIQAETDLPPEAVRINLKAIAINNGDYSYEHNMNGDLWWMFGHAIVSYNQFSAAQVTCKGNFYKNRAEPNCAATIAKLMQQMDGILNLNVLSDCYGGANGTFPGEVIPCWNSVYLDNFFNEKEAFEDFHVAEEWFTTTKKWETCSVEILARYNNSEHDTTIPELKTIHKSGIKMLLMNGDLDDNCCNLANQWSVNDVLEEKIESFDPWYYYYPDKPKEAQVGGFYQMKDGLIFATVRGAGHMVSTYQPFRSNVLYQKFFQGTFPH